MAALERQSLRLKFLLESQQKLCLMRVGRKVRRRCGVHTRSPAVAALYA